MTLLSLHYYTIMSQTQNKIGSVRTVLILFLEGAFFKTLFFLLCDVRCESIKHRNNVTK